MTSNGTEIVRVERLSKAFGVVQALSDVSLGFRAGEVLGLVGENGAGKSTLMRLLEGAHMPDRGEIAIDGVPLNFREPKEAHAAGIRVIHQEPDIVPDLTVAENIFVGAMPRRLGILLDWPRLEEQTRAVLARFGMQNELRARDLCARLGPAQRQMIEIMRAVRAGGRLIAFDEPTSSLTDEEARHLYRIIRHLKADGVSIVYISHRLNEIIDLADRVAVLRDGRLVADQAAAGLTERAISQLMVGRELRDLFRRQKAAKTNAILTVSGLSSEAVHDVSLTLHRGEVLGIGGLMGAGRSELARAIVGYDRRLAGEIVVDGKRLPPNDVAASIAAGIGLAPEDRKSEALLLARSILDNATLCVPERISTAGLFDRRKAIATVSPLAGKLSIRTPSLDQLVSKLSGGNQQKVVLARWLARQLKVIILDEPTRGIDIGAKAEIYQLIAELAAGGMGVLLISSEMPELIGLADRVLVMAEGRITGELGADADEQSILALSMPQSARAQREVRT
ncbi:sugar ABC transporter ATP-binding protein [Mesorhizobium sp. BAC0120]|uniref:sugar ABC transporter ATP-binding protein n=1 Tax=Mesorhizobium sp. BAC0120 TaxID=3090670 RepID=UPI00298D35C1|nr:sugar ABC transporter ATP-binding protein [Mesorhizobium sp. BAC0120]MDW6024242.1 sugar ABC transporter ATP-binding protein [Mesorhizobium sp. BAC0120]